MGSWTFALLGFFFFLVGGRAGALSGLGRPAATQRWGCGLRSRSLCCGALPAGQRYQSRKQQARGKKILAENGMESEVRENASAILNDRPPFIKIDANWWIFIFICVSLSCSNENIFFL
jgi:hypothetical protein